MRTPTSEVYTACQNAEKVVLKLLTPFGFENEHEGTIALRHFDGHGAVRRWTFAYACLSAAWFGDAERYADFSA